MRKHFIAALMAVLTAQYVHADILSIDDLSYYGRVGYNIGGTAPVGMPATIRKLSSYRMQPNFMLGIDAYKPLGDRWGLMTGLHLERKDMKTDAKVKNYHMAIQQGTQSLEGVYTGQVATDVTIRELTIPVLATYDVSQKVRVKCGPYVSYVYDKNFCGHAHDGYIRVGDPTGTKVNIGSDEGTRGTYDFSDDMRRWFVGIDLGMDWYSSERWGASIGLSWGLNGVFKKNFSVLEDTLYPIYGNIGISYKIK